MRIESLIQRDGGSKIEFADATYHFKPVVAGGPHVADVENPAHIEALLKITEGFREDPAAVSAREEQIAAERAELEELRAFKAQMLAAQGKTPTPAATETPVIGEGADGEGEGEGNGGSSEPSPEPADANGDGRVSKAEAVAAYTAKHGKAPPASWSIPKILKETEATAAPST